MAVIHVLPLPHPGHPIAQLGSAGDIHPRRKKTLPFKTRKSIMGT
jgi:hypothetical protein